MKNVECQDDMSVSILEIICPLILRGTTYYHMFLCYVCSVVYASPSVRVWNIQFEYVFGAVYIMKV